MTYHMNDLDETTGEFFLIPAEEMFARWRAHPETAPEPEVVVMYQQIADHNNRLAILDKERKLTVDEMFGQNYMRDAVRIALAGFIESFLKRDCRNPDGSIDLYRSYDDGCWDNPECIVAALVPLVIEIYDHRYGGNVRGGIDWLRQKTLLMLRDMDRGDYTKAAGCIADGSCFPPDSRN
jgi:hypothetical protein